MTLFYEMDNRDFILGVGVQDFSTHPRLTCIQPHVLRREHAELFLGLE
jgi:hypothetical protein